MVPAVAPIGSITIAFDIGTARQIRGTALVGRSPVSDRQDVLGAELIPIDDSTMSVSKTHLAIGVDEFGCWVEDRNSTNGVLVTEADGQQIRVSPTRRARVQRGSRIHFGDRWFDIC